MASMGYHKRIRDENSTSAPAASHYASLDVKNVYTGPTKRRNEFCGLMNLEVLEACLKVVWESISQERLGSLIRSMPARLQAVIDAEGGATPY